MSKGAVLFAHPNDALAAVEYALRLAHDKELMLSKPGEVMGYLAYAHPFLDGNGRTIMVVHTELSQRADFSIDWAATEKTAYLTALTHELDSSRAPSNWAVISSSQSSTEPSQRIQQNSASKPDKRQMEPVETRQIRLRHN